jgi:hypothetical protein
MGAFKSLTSQDIIVSPLTVHRSSSSAISIPFLLGKNTSYNSVDDESNSFPWPSASLVYASVKQLYYSNTFPNDPQPYIVIDNQGNVIEGSQTANVNSRYENYLQSGLEAIRNFPTGSDSSISPSNLSNSLLVGIISQSLFGDYIKPGSLSIYKNNERILFDDGQGNIVGDGTVEPIFDTTFQGNKFDFPYLGNVIYTHGIIILTGGSAVRVLDVGNHDIQFISVRTVYETQYKCTIRPDEFNYSQNPTLLSGSQLTNPIIASGSSINTSGDVVDFVTGSAFAPYVTAVGLYNTNNELLAVAKLSQPIPTSRTVDMNIVINMDK